MSRFRFLILIFCTLVLFPCRIASQAPGSATASAAAFYEQGRNYMSRENWYSAVESFLECIRLNSAHAEGNAALAECYYELAEFDEALVWVRKARALARGSMSVANLEVFTLIALGR